MPTKLPDGSASFFQVSSETASPVMPEKPSPPPLLPNAVGVVTLASASVNVIPSAPAPGPMNASNAAVTPAPGTGVGQNADPATQFVFGVTARFGGDAVGASCAAPLSCHPPSTGDGTVPGGAPGP